MKKIIFLIITLFISFNVYALPKRDYKFKEYTYRVTIDGETYLVTAKYFEDPSQPDSSNSKYSLDESSIVLTNSRLEKFSYNANYPYKILPIGGRFCSDSPDVYACSEDRTEFSKEEIENPNFMLNYLPKFVKYNNAYTADGRAAFLYYIGDETNVSEEQKKDFFDKIKKFFSGFNYNKEPDIQAQTKQEYTSSDDISYDDIGTFDDVNTKDLSTKDYIDAAQKLRELVEKAKDIKVCTEDDLNKIRTKREYSLIELDKAFDDVPLSSSCYDILFGNGLGNGNLFTNVIRGINYMSDKGAVTNDDEWHDYAMGFLYYETYYLEGVGVLTGELMQKENKEPVKCSLFGDKTTAIFQYAFTILKYVGVILGTLLGVVDVFKIIVSKDVDGKKQFKVLSKRIIAIVALILTPVLVEIIFNFINTFGIQDPLCGIR